MSPLFSLLLCVLALFASTSFAMPADLKEIAEARNSTGVASSTCTITEYVLALQHDCGFESIHGLWPDPASSCTSCTTEAFSTSKLSSSTLSDMNKYWPTCQSGANEDFWSHEWSKHGTCTGMTQDAYFSKGISLYKSYQSKCTTTCNLCFTPTYGYKGVC